MTDKFDPELISESDAEHISYWVFHWEKLRKALPDNTTEGKFYDWVSGCLTEKEGKELYDAVDRDQFNRVIYLLIKYGFEEHSLGGELDIPQDKKELYYKWAAIGEPVDDRHEQEMVQVFNEGLDDGSYDTWKEKELMF